MVDGGVGERLVFSSGLFWVLGCVSLVERTDLW